MFTDVPSSFSKFLFTSLIASFISSAAVSALSASFILETGAPKIARNPSPRYLSTMPLYLNTILPITEKKLFNKNTVFCGPISIASSVNPLISRFSKVSFLNSSTRPFPVSSPSIIVSRTSLGTNF